MQFTTSLLALSVGIASALAGMVTASPVTDGIPTHVLAVEELQHWIATTDAKLTFTGSGKHPSPLARDVDSAEEHTITVVYCSSNSTTTSSNVCGDECTVYTGGPACLYTPNTVCIYATSNLLYCNGSCGSTCHEYNECPSPLPGGFCYTPGTSSIFIEEV